MKKFYKNKAIFPEPVYQTIIEYADNKSLLSLDGVCQYTNQQNNIIWKERFESWIFKNIKLSAFNSLTDLQSRIGKDYKEINNEYKQYHNRIAWINDTSNRVSAITFFVHGGSIPLFQRQEYYERTVKKKNSIDSAIKTINDSKDLKNLSDSLEKIKDDDGIKLHREDRLYNIFCCSKSQKEVISLQREVKSIYTNLQKRTVGN